MPKPSTTGTQGPTPLRPKNTGELIKERGADNARWKEHSNWSSQPRLWYCCGFLQFKPTTPNKRTLWDLHEVRTSIKMKNNTAPWIDGIPADVFKEAGAVARIQHLSYRSFKCRMTRKSLMTFGTPWVNISKKRNRSDCGNYREIAPLSIARRKHHCNNPSKPPPNSCWRDSPGIPVWLHTFTGHNY